MPEKKEKYYHIASLEKGIRVLELLAEEKELSVSAVGVQLGYNRAASHRFLATLRDLGYVEKNSENRYQLTFKVLELGMKVANRFEIRALARPFMQELSGAFNETVNLGQFNGKDVVHLDKIDSHEILRMDSALGSLAPAYCTALGKAILAHMPPDELQAYFNRIKLKPHGPKTITSKKALRQELKKIRETGYATDDEELALGLRCIASPVVDHTGQVCYALSVSGPAMRMTPETVNRIRETIVDVCRRFSNSLGRPGKF